MSGFYSYLNMAYEKKKEKKTELDLKLKKDLRHQSQIIVLKCLNFAIILLLIDGFSSD